MKSMPKDERRDLVWKGLEGGGCILKSVIAKWGGGGTIFICYYFLCVWGGGRGKVLIHHTFLKTPDPV